MSAGTSQSFRLTPAMRLRSQADFRRLKQGGERVPSGCLIANWQPQSPGGLTRLAVITSRRLGDAVERSRARRLLREAFRLHQHDLSCPVDMVLVARQSILGRKRQEVEQDLLKAWRRGGLLRQSA